MPFDGGNYDTQVTNPVTEILEQAWRLIDRPQKWCRDQPRSVDGRRQCSMSALYSVAHGGNRAGYSATGVDDDDGYAIATRILALAMPGPGPTPAPFTIATFNDNHSHAEVAAAWQRAIALSRSLQRDCRILP